ncbi:ATP-binding protein (plasmid) [Skermanella rosea]|uniref:ATP-binding protein n=1 Tax=Skermanella rosea TaxID=1817965 RepID=UPI0019326E7D|nr:ATP-binding protein [Skermanella rosea]UEM07936.1 ATP-binding protein [Skermanella rosea]
MPGVHVLMGLPGSGKTTWRRRFLAEHTGSAHAVGRDDIVEEMAAAHGITYAESWRTFSRAIDKEFRRRLNEAFTLDHDVVVDNTNLTAKARRRILGRVPRGWERIGVIFDIPEPQLVDRLLARGEAGGKQVAPWLVRHMRSHWVPPSPTEFDQLLIIRPGPSALPREIPVTDCARLERRPPVVSCIFPQEPRRTSAMPEQPDTPERPNTADTAAANPAPPSRYLQQGEAGMVSQADLQDATDGRLEQDRRDNVNPSLAREEPVETTGPGGGGSDEQADR